MLFKSDQSLVGVKQVLKVGIWGAKNSTFIIMTSIEIKQKNI